MKKWHLRIAILTAVALLAGCGNKQSATEQSKADAAASTRIAAAASTKKANAALKRRLAKQQRPAYLAGHPYTIEGKTLNGNADAVANTIIEAYGTKIGMTQANIKVMQAFKDADTTSWGSEFGNESDEGTLRDDFFASLDHLDGKTKRQFERVVAYLQATKLTDQYGKTKPEKHASSAQTTLQSYQGVKNGYYYTMTVWHPAGGKVLNIATRSWRLSGVAKVKQVAVATLVKGHVVGTASHYPDFDKATKAVLQKAMKVDIDGMPGAGADSVNVGDSLAQAALADDFMTTATLKLDLGKLADGLNRQKAATATTAFVGDGIETVSYQ